MILKSRQKGDSKGWDSMAWKWHWYINRSMSIIEVEVGNIKVTFGAELFGKKIKGWMTLKATQRWMKIEITLHEGFINISVEVYPFVEVGVGNAKVTIWNELFEEIKMTPSLQTISMASIVVLIPISFNAWYINESMYICQRRCWKYQSEIMKK